MTYLQAVVIVVIQLAILTGLLMVVVALMDLRRTLQITHRMVTGKFVRSELERKLSV